MSSRKMILTRTICTNRRINIFSFMSKKQQKIRNQLINSINCVHSTGDVLAIINYIFSLRNLGIEINSIGYASLKHDRDDITLCLIYFFLSANKQTTLDYFYSLQNRNTQTQIALATYIMRVKIAFNRKIGSLSFFRRAIF